MSIFNKKFILNEKYVSKYAQYLDNDYDKDEDNDDDDKDEDDDDEDDDDEDEEDERCCRESADDAYLASLAGVAMESTYGHEAGYSSLLDDIMNL